ncbi:MAG: endonuclease/exonuclease/phosphatase family protein [Rhodospirillales bacterium]|nr:endonuclease/exonuclease/phosphatase family protein [Rhodospirillales bacterium]MDE0379205.1 endonuclease/exonuclease/phosphatase family protein [Rhodospirillales bacterium]
MLRVLTFNTGLTEIRLFGAALYEDVPHVVPRAARLAPALRVLGADIVLLQELVPQRVKRALATELRDLYPHTAGIDEDTRFYGTGLLTLSRHPIEDAACTPFAEQTFEEGLFGPRGMLICTVRTPGLGPCRVLNLHATAGGASRKRRRQGVPGRKSAQIAEAIAAAGAPFDGPVVLGGDFNSDPATDAAAGKRLGAAGFSDASALVPGSLGPPGTWDPANPLNRSRASGPARRVDHIFVRSRGGQPVEARDVRIVLDEPAVPVPEGDAVPLSDHYGLLATLAPSARGI